MTLRIVPTNDDRLRLDPRALRLLIDALALQVEAWRRRLQTEADEDERADLQNDIMYAEILLANLEVEFQRLTGS